MLQMNDSKLPPLKPRHSGNARKARGKGNKRQKTTAPTLEDAFAIDRDMMNRSSKEMGAIESEDRRFRDLLGVGPLVALAAFSMICEAGLLPEGGALLQFFWYLAFMKVYATETPMCALCGGIDPQTLRKWVWLFIGALAMLEPDLIVWEDRFKGDKGNDCLVSVDGTDFRIPNHGSDFASHKYKKKSALRYEVCICILTGDIVWIHGPFEAGMWPDISIFRDALIHQLAPAERTEANGGYMGEAPRYVKCPKSLTTSKETKFMSQRVRSRQETGNNRFKFWGILKQVYRHEVADHGDAFCACAVLTQLSINMGEPLFSCGYRDPPYNNPPAFVNPYAVPESDDESL